MSRPRLLDLFCGAGGCSVGYHRAGFDVVGVDINPQPRYPFEFHQANALTFPFDGFDAIHASPPCQAYASLAGDGHPDLLGLTIQRLQNWGTDRRTWVVENIPDAVLKVQTFRGLRLCGSLFGLGVRRHRIFASNVFLMGPPCAHGLQDAVRAYYGKPGTIAWKPPGWDNVQKEGRAPLYRGTVDQAPADMGIDWMTWDELREAIPPAYTEYIGAQLLDHLQAGAA
jgi:hypothetical protein